MKKLVLGAVALVFTFQSALADVPAPQAPVVLNPAKIRELVLNSNLSLVQAMNNVHDAKDRVNIARGNLLPSINLGGAIAMASGATFVLASASFLLPFLMPSRWFDQAQSKDLFESEKLSFQLSELNTYSSTLSLYLTIQSDQEIRKVYEDQARSLRQIADILEVDYHLGTATKEAWQQADAQALMAEANASKLAELAAQEKAAMRMALGLPLDAQFEFGPAEIPFSEWESKPLSEAAEAAKNASLERRQVDYLVSAAKSATWSKAFSFLNAFSLAGTAGAPGESVSFDKSSFTGSVNFGFAYFPTLSLSQRSIEEMKLQGDIIEQQSRRLIEATTLSLVEAQRQYTVSQRAEDEMKSVYEATVLKYQLGSATLLDVLTASSQLATSSVSRIKSRLDVDTLRVTLHRAYISDQFAEIPACKLNEPVNDRGSGGFWGWFRGATRGNGGAAMSPEKACRGT